MDDSAVESVSREVVDIHQMWERPLRRVIKQVQSRFKGRLVVDWFGSYDDEVKHDEVDLVRIAELIPRRLFGVVPWFSAKRVCCEVIATLYGYKVRCWVREGRLLPELQDELVRLGKQEEKRMREGAGQMGVNIDEINIHTIVRFGSYNIF